MDGKPIYQSKTVLFNLLALLVTVATAFGYGEFHPDPAVESIAAVIVIVVNLVLRLLTSQSIRMR